MRRLVAPGVGAVVCALVVAGCAATTDPPSDVTASSAVFRAQGRTDNTPAHYFFQYSVNPNALGTGFGQQTPTRGPIPAGVQTSGGGLVPFSEAVSGLKPATTYYYRVCGGDGQTSGDVCAQTRSFTTPDGVVFDKPGVHQATVPEGVTRAQLDVSGAEGGKGSQVNMAVGPGGLGAHVRATLGVQSGQTLVIVVGGRGGDAQGNFGGSAGSGVGNDGAVGGDGSGVGAGGGGGGGSDVSTGSGGPSGLPLVVLVAGGGGGGAQTVTGPGARGGAGGATGANGQDGTCTSSFGPCTPLQGGGGGGANAGGTGASGVHDHVSGNPDGANGAHGRGGAGGTNTYVDGQLLIFGVGAGGGAGGYYGGGGGGAGEYTRSAKTSPSAGGGGSSFITPSALCSSPVDTGAQSGDGVVTITYNPPSCP